MTMSGDSSSGGWGVQAKDKNKSWQVGMNSKQWTMNGGLEVSTNTTDDVAVPPLIPDTSDPVVRFHI